MLVWLTMLLVGVVWAQEAPEGSEEAAEAPTELVVAISPFSPFVTLDDDAPQGFSVELWKALAEAQGVPYRFEAYDNVSDKLAAVRDGTAHVAIGGISVTLEREQTVDFSLATFRTGLDILVRNEQAGLLSLQTLKAAATPGRVGIIGGFFLLIVVSGHLVWLAEQGKEAFSDRYFPGVFEGMYWAIVTASTVGYGDKAPVRWTGRAVAAAVIIVSLPMFAIFTAELASTLTVATLETSISSADDLKGRTVGVVGGTTGEASVKQLGATAFPYPSATEAVNALIEGDVEAVVHDAPNLRELKNQHGGDDLVALGRLFEPQSYGLAVQQGSELREQINQALLAVHESGQWDAIRTQWFEGDLGQ
ncbi:MAG: transporter substrate-binding domain-containing protein [Myxococcales bacterium]|nr:transporter substrate-binding domain-containing protein [Myxococcales bacterium]